MKFPLQSAFYPSFFIMPTRRQFLTQSATLAAAIGTSWLGYRYLNRLPTVNVNYAGLPLGHLLRDGALPMQAHRQAQCNVLILGSGAAALTAAWQLSKLGQRDVFMAEGFERHGNQAAYTVSGSLNSPTGAHYLAQPSRESRDVRDLLCDLNILQYETPDGVMTFSETDLVHAPDERVFYQNEWHDGLQIQDDDSKRFFQFINQIKHAYGSDGRKLFAIPIALSSQDPTWRRLDQITFAQWLKSQHFQSPNLLWYLDYACRDDYGQGIEQVSAFAGLHYFAARGSDDAAVLTWSDGLNHIAEKTRQFINMNTLDRLPETAHWQFNQPTSCAASALKITEQNDRVEVLLRHNHTGEVVNVSAQYVICAMPLMVATRIIDRAAQYGLTATELPEYAPWLVSNFVLHRFPNEPKNTELAWDNVVYGSRGLGYVVATHQHIHVAKPDITAYTAYTALNHDTPQNMRKWLLTATPHDLLAIAAQDLLTVYGKTFWQCVSHVDITVRAHAMSVPKVGYLSQPMLLKLRQHHSRLLFAHSDLSGYSVFEEAAYWGAEAARKIVQAA